MTNNTQLQSNRKQINVDVSVPPAQEDAGKDTPKVDETKKPMDVCNRDKASFLERVFYYYARPIYDMQAEGNPIT